MADEIVMHSANIEMKPDYYSSLARLVAQVSRDHAQLRTFVYEFARVKLRKDLYREFVEGDWSEVAEKVRELEAAITQIEADFAQNAPQLQFNSEPALTQPIQEQSARNALVMRPGSQNATTIGDDGAQVQSPIFSLSPYEARASSVSIAAEADDALASAFLGKHLRSRSWWITELILAAVLGVAIYITSDTRSALSVLGLHWVDEPTNISAANEVGKEQNVALGGKELEPKANATFRRAVPDIPLPTEYGVYAVTHGQLTELDQLPIKPPDQRVAISASIPTPSRVHLPFGQLQFVVFRRDLTTNAPDRVSVRVMARVTRALTFDSEGTAKVANIEQSWVIRSNSYQMRVAPVADNPEMIAIRPEPADFVFPAGRYALVLKGVAYDFTVDGGVTDTAHCLERTDALNTPIYTECRNSSGSTSGAHLRRVKAIERNHARPSASSSTP
jgi:hypothetical protein